MTAPGRGRETKAGFGKVTGLGIIEKLLGNGYLHEEETLL